MSIHNTKKITILWVVTIIFFCCFFTWDMNRYVKRLPEMSGSLQRWLPITQDLNLGADLYRKHPDYLYPPIFLMLLKPLNSLDMPFRAIVFHGLKYGCLLLTFFLTWQLAKKSFGTMKLTFFLLAVIYTIRFFESDLSHGNVNIFLLFFVTLGIWLWQRENAVLGGLLIALAVSIKVTPILIFVYAAWKREWKCAIGGLIGLILFLLIFPGFYLGWSENLSILASWFDHVIIGFSKNLEIDAIHMNQSLSAVLIRYLTPTRAMKEPLHFINIASLSRETVGVIFKVCAIALLGISWFGLRGKFLNKRSPIFLFHLSILFVLMLLLSGYSWHAHCVYLFLPYLVIILYWSQQKRTIVRRLIESGLVVSFVSGSLLTSVAGPYYNDLFDSYGAVTFTFLILFVMLVMFSAKLSEEIAAPPYGARNDSA